MVPLPAFRKQGEMTRENGQKQGKHSFLWYKMGTHVALPPTSEGGRLMQTPQKRYEDGILHEK